MKIRPSNTMKPILFNTEMVRAILDDRKTVTRRVLKPHNTRKANRCEYLQGEGFSSIGLSSNLISISAIARNMG